MTNAVETTPSAADRRAMLVAGDEAYLAKHPDERDGEDSTAFIDRLTQTGRTAEAGTNCEHCGTGFIPRSGSGGRPQRFCSPDCKSAFHAQRRQRAPTCSDQTSSDDRVKADATADVSDDFNWQDSDAVVLPEQQAVAAYLAANGSLVIRQAGWPDDDHVIVIEAANVAAFIAKLTDIIGIPTMGR